MTARRRRRARVLDDGDSIPAAVAAWFAGETSAPWESVLPGSYERVPGWWTEWLKAHPDATPPADANPYQFPPA